MHFLKKIIKFAIIAGILYVLLSYHFIVIGKSVKLLKKSEVTLAYTIYSTKGKTIEKILSEENLWNAGIGELLVKEGMISEEKLEMYKENLKKDDH
jgi:hypothetical protein